MSAIFKYLNKNLINWYLQYGRDFPWRYTTDPYNIMIAEFMLHRTKAEQVVPVYIKFIEKYPDIFSLAKARYSDIKHITRHLGLHWRSKHFIEAARYVIKNYDGSYPDNYDDLRKIPGIGEYIAGAILVISFSKPAPVVDSNIARFINRVWNLNLEGEIRRKKEIIQISNSLFDCGNPGKFLFALIDFTSMICKPRKPECEKCFVKHKICKYSSKPSPSSSP